MTDKEMILEILERANITIFSNNSDYIEIENDRSSSEPIYFDFSVTGKLLSMWSWDKSQPLWYNKKEKRKLKIIIDK